MERVLRLRIIEGGEKDEKDVAFDRGTPSRDCAGVC